MDLNCSRENRVNTAYEEIRYNRILSFDKELGSLQNRKSLKISVGWFGGFFLWKTMNNFYFPSLFFLN